MNNTKMTLSLSTLTRTDRLMLKRSALYSKIYRRKTSLRSSLLQIRMKMDSLTMMSMSMRVSPMAIKISHSMTFKSIEILLYYTMLSIRRD